jgi:acyl carrier protein
MEKIEKILQEIRPEFVFTPETDLITEGILDSFDLITLVSELDKEFGISIAGVDILPGNFCSIHAIRELLKQYGVEP